MKREGENQIIAEGRHIRFAERDGWEYAQRRNVTGIVGIVAVTDDDRIVLVEQYRLPLQAPAIELPAGLAGDQDGAESLEAAARRELLEETGYTAEHWSVLMSGATSPGITDERVTLFLAKGLRREQAPMADDTGRITVHEMPLADAKRRLQEWSTQGKWVNFMVHAALYMLRTEG